MVDEARRKQLVEWAKKRTDEIFSKHKEVNVEPLVVDKGVSVISEWLEYSDLSAVFADGSLKPDSSIILLNESKANLVDLVYKSKLIPLTFIRLLISGCPFYDSVKEYGCNPNCGSIFFEKGSLCASLLNISHSYKNS